MRQVFTSPRLENVERVAKLLREEGIETKVTNPRSYRGARRGNFSYRESPGSDTWAAVWVVRSDDQPKARELLREMGLLDSGRSPTSYLPTPHETRAGDGTAADASRRRAFRIKAALMFGIAIAMGLGMMAWRRNHVAQTPAVAARPAAATRATAGATTATGTAAAPADDTYIIDTPSALASMLIVAELRAHDAALTCISVDDKDPKAEVFEQLAGDRARVRAASTCGGADAMNALSVDVSGYRTDGSGAGTVRVLIGDLGPDGRRREEQRMLEVERVDIRWKVKGVVL